jgi:ribonucleoside-triphosphate reductase
LEATPGEGAMYRFARLDKKRFGRIIVANDDAVKNGSEPYYTNSSHLPVNFTDDVFESLDLQDELQCKYTGGTVFHTFVGEKMTKDSVRKMVKKISDNYHLPYFTLTPTFSICPIHGYLSGEHEYCPKCDVEQEALLLESKVSSKEQVVDFVEDGVGAKGVGEASIVVSEDSIKVVEPGIKRETLVPMRSKLNVGGDDGED